MVKNKKSAEKIDKREEKHRRISSSIANLKTGAVVTPTDLSHQASTHPDTMRDFLDSYDSLRTIGFKILRDNNRIIKAVIKTEENPDLNIKEELSLIKTSLAEIKEMMKKR